MRTCLAFLLLWTAVPSFAVEVRCYNDSRTEGLIYNPGTSTMDIGPMRGEQLVAPHPVEIEMSQITDRPQPNTDESIFSYPLRDGRTVDIVWQGRESEILRGQMPRPLKARVRQGSEFSHCTLSKP